MDLSSLTQKGQVTIPAIYRQALNLQPKDQVRFLFDKKKAQIIIEKHSQPVDELFGMYTVEHAVSDEQIKKAIKKGASRDRGTRY